MPASPTQLREGLPTRLRSLHEHSFTHGLSLFALTQDLRARAHPRKYLPAHSHLIHAHTQPPHLTTLPNQPAPAPSTRSHPPTLRTMRVFSPSRTLGIPPWIKRDIAAPAF
ncbi:hypothetical protein FIBSPDRAFT_964169 [Athelia psychrophila]|uniref:Uncharacterized protein n=1 Tax=Athelia psychrophila TaxID=1759441 RepID=A0A165Y326_9AGAM|nr:hypothetical protein FIBSPDRAFT_964169 [Fibularhizoctonia sp. CBS 109695]